MEMVDALNDLLSHQLFIIIEYLFFHVVSQPLDIVVDKIYNIGISSTYLLLFLVKSPFLRGLVLIGNKEVLKYFYSF